MFADVVSKASEKKGMLELHVGCCTHAGGHDSLDWKCSPITSLPHHPSLDFLAAFSIAAEEE